MSDVARLAGVNRVTASVALSGNVQSSTRVSEATRQRVLEAARELGYTPNAVALALRGQRTNIVGHYVGEYTLNAHDPFTAAIINGLQQRCYHHQHDLLMFGSFERHSVEETFNTLTSGKVDGLVILPTPINPIVEELRNSHLPVVAIANAVAGIPSVVVDDDAGSQILVDYLNRLGHRHVVYHADPRGHVSTIRRQIAFTQAAAALDMTVTIVPARFDHFLSTEELTLLHAENGIRPTAIVAWADYHAFMLMEACLQKGFRIPDDIAIVGFNGIQLDIRPTLELTTIRAPWQQVAGTAVDVLMKLINGEEVPEETVLPVEFVKGDTA